MAGLGITLAPQALRQGVKAARTICKYKECILAYIDHRLTNGIVEGNNRLRPIARRAYGFHSPKPIIAMLFLFCGGIIFDPPIPGMPA